MIKQEKINSSSRECSLVLANFCVKNVRLGWKRFDMAKTSLFGLLGGVYTMAIIALS
jgi:hypothetical protein